MMRETPENYAFHIISRPLAQLSSQLPGAYKNKGIEPLHRIRVAIRRLRNSFWVFKDFLPFRKLTSWKKCLKKVTDCSGEARDIDVKIDFLNSFSKSLSSPSHKRGLKKLISLIRKKRAGLQPVLNKALKELEKKRVVPGIKEELSGLSRSNKNKGTALSCLAGKKISKRIKDLSLQAPLAIAPDKTEELHDFRIKAKKLRYTLECFIPLYGKELEIMAEEIHKIQNALGATHDLDVWMHALGLMAPDENSDKDMLLAKKQLLRELSRLRTINYRKFALLWRKMQKKGFLDKISSFITKKTDSSL